MKWLFSSAIFLTSLWFTSGSGTPNGQYLRVFADFEAEQLTVEQGQKVKFMDRSKGHPNFWSWSFEQGLPNRAIGATPEVYYAKAGVYDVTITVSDGESTDTKVMKDYIKVRGVLHNLRFDGMLRDDANVNTAIEFNARPQFERDRSGAAGRALHLIGHERIKLPPNQRFKTNELSLSLWLKAPKKQDTQMIIVEQYAGRSADFGFRLLLTNGHLQFEGRDGSQLMRSSGLSRTTVDDNEWHHVVAVMTADSQWQVWVDGILEAHNAYTYTIPEQYNPANLTIGHSERFDFRTFEGLLDEVVIYNKALSMRSIVELLN